MTTPTRQLSRRLQERARRAKLAARSNDTIAALQLARYPDGVKQCNACDQPRPLGDFLANRCKKDGLGSKCFACAGRTEPWGNRP